MQQETTVKHFLISAAVAVGVSALTIAVVFRNPSIRKAVTGA
jgi:hypothetical protein